MNKSLFKRATAIAAASALALSATLIAPLLASAATCPGCDSAVRGTRGYESLDCPKDGTHSTTGKDHDDVCGVARGECGGALTTGRRCGNPRSEPSHISAGTIGQTCTTAVPCPGTFAINCPRSGSAPHTPEGTLGNRCEAYHNCYGDIRVTCSNSNKDCIVVNTTSGTAGACTGQKRVCMGGTVVATCSAGHTPIGSIDADCGADVTCEIQLDAFDACTEGGHAPVNSGEGNPCGYVIGTCDVKIVGVCPTCDGIQTTAGNCTVASGGYMEACDGIVTARCSNNCGTPSNTGGMSACTNQVQCTATISSKCTNTSIDTGCGGATTGGIISDACTSYPIICGGTLTRDLTCARETDATNPIVHTPTEGDPATNCGTDLGPCDGVIAGVTCTNAWHDATDDDNGGGESSSGNGGGETSSGGGGGGGSVVADMIAGGGIGGGGGGTNNTESGGGGKEVKVIADSAEAKLAVGNATRGTVTLSPDMGATSDVLEALTTVGANVKVWIPHGTHGVAIKGSDLGEGELKDLSFKGGAVAVPESIKSSFPEAKSITGMGFVESGDFGGVDQVMLSVKLDLDPKLWGSVITVYSVGEDGSLTKLEASRIVSGNGMVNVTITNYNSLIFVV